MYFPIFATLKNINMGRGDSRTRKGKIFAGSFGNARPARVKKTDTPAQAVVATETEVKKKAEKKG